MDVICIDDSVRSEEDDEKYPNPWRVKKGDTYSAIRGRIGYGIFGQPINCYEIEEDPLHDLRGWNINRFDIIPEVDLESFLWPEKILEHA